MADLIRKILIGRYFSATADAPQNSIITAITAGGKPALLGVPLRVTPNMRIVVQGHNLTTYNRFLIITSGNQAYPVLPKFSRDREFEYWAFDVPNYGDNAFTFSLRLASIQPDIFAFEIDNFDYAQETEEEKKDREKKAAEAAAAQEKAEAEQKNIKRDEFEKKGSGAILSGGLEVAAAGILGGVAEGVAAVASTIDKTAAPVVHKWQGTTPAEAKISGGVNNENLKPTDFSNAVNLAVQPQPTTPGQAGARTVNSSRSAGPPPSFAVPPSTAGVSDITGQAPVIRRTPPQQAQPQVVPSAPAAAFPGPNQPLPSSPPLSRQAVSQQPQQGAHAQAAQSAPQVQQGAPLSAALVDANSATPLNESKQRQTDSVIQDIQGSPSSSRGQHYGGGVILTGTGTYKSPRSSSRFDAAGNLQVSAEVGAGQSSESSIGVQESVRDELSVEQRGTLHESSDLKQTANIGDTVNQSSSVALADNIEQSVEQAGAPQAPTSATKTPTSTAPPSRAEPFKNRRTLELEKEFDAKYAGSGIFKKNARDLDVKLKRPEGGRPPSVAVSVDRTGTSRQQTVESSANSENDNNRVTETEGTESNIEDDEQEEQENIPDVSDVQEELKPLNNPEPLNDAATRQEAINLPQKLPADLSSRSAAVEGLPTGEAAAAEAGGVMVGAEAGAVAAGPAGLAVAGAGMMATKDGREKAIKGAANVVAGPEAGIAISFFKKHWKMILGLLAGFLTVVVGLILVFSVTLIQYMCTNLPSFAIYLSGYSNVCTTIKNFGVGSILPAGTTPGQLNTNPGSGQCSPVASGPASVASLQSTCFGGNAQQASSISAAESGGNPASLSQSDKCADGNSVSVGLFQINLTNHPINGLNCPAAFSSQYTASNKTCIVVNQALYQSCVTAAETPAYNIAEACVISNNGASWTQWGSDSKCGF